MPFNTLVVGDRCQYPVSFITSTEVLDFSQATLESLDFEILSGDELDFSTATLETGVT